MHDNDEIRFDLGTRMPDRMRKQFSRLIGMTAAQAGRASGRALADVGARKHHFAVLAALAEFGPTSQAGLSDRTGIYRSDLVATINELSDGGYVRRAPDPGDKRRNVISMTDTGAARLDQLDGILGTVGEQVLAPLSGDEREQLFALLRRVNEHLADSA